MILPGKYKVLELVIPEDQTKSKLIVCNEFGADCDVSILDMLSSVVEGKGRPLGYDVVDDELFEFPAEFEVIDIIEYNENLVMYIRL